MSSGLQKPFLKWVGGKTQLIDKIIEKLPKEMNNYHELFLGGGSVLLAVLSLRKQGKIVINDKIYAYDVNGALIDVYKDIQNHREELYKLIECYIKEYDNIQGEIINRKPSNVEEALTSKESYYYWLRNKFNNIKSHTLERSALFMIINKLCFRGIYREGPNGYNVPYGHYKKTPVIISKDNLDAISELIKDVYFIRSDFEESIKRVKDGDFTYLDPPYAPENDKSFVGYVEGGFDLTKHNKLFDEVKKMGGLFIMSNANVSMVNNAFASYDCEEVVARRAINSKKPGSKTTEVLVSQKTDLANLAVR
jgi:DNA adenine methylase